MRILKMKTWLPAVASLSFIIPRASAALLTPRDTCAQLDAELDVLGIVFGDLNVCLCIGGIDEFIKTNGVAKAAADALGKGVVEVALDLLITSGPRVSSCHSGPTARKRSPAELARLEHKCEWGLTKCGLPTGLSFTEMIAAAHESREPTRAQNTSNQKRKTASHIIAPADYGMVEAYECLDVQTNLESCGGCTSPYTLGLSKREIDALAPGVDCTAEEGVSDVECLRGACVVRKCRKGWELAPVEGGNGALECVKKGSKKVQNSTAAGAQGGELHAQVGGVLEWRDDKSA